MPSSEKPAFSATRRIAALSTSVLSDTRTALFLIEQEVGDQRDRDRAEAPAPLVAEQPDPEIEQPRRLVGGIPPRLHVADQLPVDVDGQVEHPLLAPGAGVLHPGAHAILRLPVTAGPRGLERASVACLLGPEPVEVGGRERPERRRRRREARWASARPGAPGREEDARQRHDLALGVGHPLLLLQRGAELVGLGPERLELACSSMITFTPARLMPLSCVRSWICRSRRMSRSE